ncbi:MAG: MFS transporter, partial [Beijerinckiaceae bacterium]
VTPQAAHDAAHEAARDTAAGNAPAMAAGLAASPFLFLTSINFINWLGFAAWQALLNNFAREQAGFDGAAIGILQSVREIPGFLAFTAVFWFMLMREQTLGYASLLLLGVGVALTGFYPNFYGLLITTMIMSVGFHYLETANQALQLQLLPKAQAPKLLGRIAGWGAVAQVVAYSSIWLAWDFFRPTYQTMYLAAGIATVALTLVAMLFFKRFEGPTPQRKGIVLRQRYGLYYALTFMSGARRQIFMAFGAFLLVERFGFSVSDIAKLLIVTCLMNTFAGPRLGALVGALGERRTIMFENVTLIVVFIGYALAAQGLFGSWGGTLAALFFIVDGVFFTLTIAQKTYFQKIADPADIAPTAAVAFTINHIAAIAIPVVFGMIWLWSPTFVFLIGIGIACMSLALSFIVPHEPRAGFETTLRRA